jgi:hypothetical protein
MKIEHHASYRACSGDDAILLVAVMEHLPLATAALASSEIVALPSSENEAQGSLREKS